MKKIVGDGVKITDEDMRKGFEANYGPRVRCRAIVCNNQRKAQEVWDLARRNPTIKNFGDLAEQYSIEANSRSLRGEVPPIQKWGGQPILEDQAFKLQPGEISGVIQMGENHVVLFCEGYTKPVEVDPADGSRSTFRRHLGKEATSCHGRRFREDQGKCDDRQLSCGNFPFAEARKRVAGARSA